MPRKTFHGSVELFAALDQYLDSKRPMPSEAEVLRTALEQFLEREGF